MKKIQILKDTSSANLEGLDSAKTLVVYRDGYALPRLELAKYVDFEMYKNAYTSFDIENLIMVGTNRIFVPQRRCDMVFEFLQTMTNSINKISIDTEPFIGEPWRVWFHYSLAYNQWLGHTYSYSVETDWSHWFYREKEESIISAESLELNLKDIFTDIDSVSYDVKFYNPDLFLSSFYNEVKRIAFDTYNTPKQIIWYMLRELNKHLKIDYNFDSYRENKMFELPCFGIYKFVDEENKRRQKIYNLFTNGKEKNI